MGITHYWRRPPILPPQDFARAVEDCRQILPRIGIPLAGADGSGPAVLCDDGILFNGVGMERCEAFVVCQCERHKHDRLQVFSFTKTHRRPYDVCVRVALIILRHHLGVSFEVSSDDARWADACTLCQEHLGYGQDFQLRR
jgi:hypothetical protein